MTVPILLPATAGCDQPTLPTRLIYDATPAPSGNSPAQRDIRPHGTGEALKLAPHDETVTALAVVGKTACQPRGENPAAPAVFYTMPTLTDIVF